MLPWQQNFLHFFACLKLFHLYTNFHLILTNNSLIIAHLDIYLICAPTCDIIIFAESAVFFLQLVDNLKSSYLWN